LAHRGRSKKPRPARDKKVVQLTGPGQQWSWDITYLKTDVAGIYYFLYLFMDVWSRKIIKAVVHKEESNVLVSQSMNEMSKVYNCKGLRLHSDNGSPMKGGTMLATMYQLGVISSFSRPRVSRDNPYSESLFKTMKYVDKYPGYFKNIEAAQQWVDGFVQWYNQEHLHSQIGYVTPEQRETGLDYEIFARRQQTLDIAHKQFHERWKGRTQAKIGSKHVMEFYHYSSDNY